MKLARIGVAAGAALIAIAPLATPSFAANPARSFPSTPVTAPGTAPGTTTLTFPFMNPVLRPYVTVTNGSVAWPEFYSSMPSSAVAYNSGGDLPVKSGQYVQLYESYGTNVLYFYQEKMAPSDIRPGGAPIAGQMPEVPFAGALPALGALGVGLLMAVRRKRTRNHA